jgi:hypothetical protein
MTLNFRKLMGYERFAVRLISQPFPGLPTPLPQITVSRDPDITLRNHALPVKYLQTFFSASATRG